MENQDAVNFFELLKESSVQRLDNVDVTARQVKRELNFLVQNNRQTYSFAFFVRFPGSQPVSFLRKHLEWLLSEDYYICEKSDGLRLMLFFPGPHKYDKSAFFIDRESNVYQIPKCLLRLRVTTCTEDVYHVLEFPVFRRELCWMASSFARGIRPPIVQNFNS
jgi:hypothetical protein